MKTRTYKVLTLIPIVGVIVKCIVDVPSIGCSPMIQDGLSDAIIAYKKSHPDIYITKQLVKKIMQNSK